MMKVLKTKISLIGGGPACASAAIQLKRSGLDILLITKNIGGNVKNADLIENLIGFPGGITGKQYTNLLKRQLSLSDIPILREEVISVQQIKNGYYSIKTLENEIISKFLIVGTGTSPIRIEIDGEEEGFQKKKLFYEISNIKNLSAGMSVIIVGSGDVAYDYAMNLSNKVKSIIILQRSSKSKALILLQEKVRKQKNIEILSERIPSSIIINQQSLELVVTSGKNYETIAGDVLLIAIGKTRNLSFLSSSLLSKVSDTLPNPTFFLIGDVNNMNNRQISVALGDGMKVAMEIVKRIRGSD